MKFDVEFDPRYASSKTYSVFIHIPVSFALLLEQKRLEYSADGLNVSKLERQASKIFGKELKKDDNVLSYRITSDEIWVVYKAFNLGDLAELEKIKCHTALAVRAYIAVLGLEIEPQVNFICFPAA